MYIYIHTCEEHSIRNLLREAFRLVNPRRPPRLY